MKENTLDKESVIDLNARRHSQSSARKEGLLHRLATTPLTGETRALARVSRLASPCTTVRRARAGRYRGMCVCVSRSMGERLCRKRVKESQEPSVIIIPPLSFFPWNEESERKSRPRAAITDIDGESERERRTRGEAASREASDFNCQIDDARCSYCIGA